MGKWELITQAGICWAKRGVVAMVALSLLAMPANQPWAQARASPSAAGATPAAPSAAALTAADAHIRANGLENVPGFYSGLGQTLQSVMPYAAAAGLAVSVYMLFRCMSKKDGKPRCSSGMTAVAAISAVLSAGALVGSLTWNNRLDAAETNMARDTDTRWRAEEAAANAMDRQGTPAAPTVLQPAPATPAARPAAVARPAAAQPALPLLPPPTPPVPVRPGVDLTPQYQNDGPGFVSQENLQSLRDQAIQRGLAQGDAAVMDRQSNQQLTNSDTGRLEDGGAAPAPAQAAPNPAGPPVAANPNVRPAGCNIAGMQQVFPNCR
jgi:hypothetical protein